jgi:hypothetical protein
MKRTGQTLLIIGILLMICSLAWGLVVYFNLSSEQRKQAPQGVIELDLTQLSDWKTATFNQYRQGEHTLYLTTVNSFSRPYAPNGTSYIEIVSYVGSIEVILQDPSGEIYFQKHLRAGCTHHIRPENMQWTALGKISLSTVRRGDWKIRARVLEADPRFVGTHSEIRLYPPQIYDIGWYAFGEWLEILGMGVLASVCASSELANDCDGSEVRLRRKRSSLPSPLFH